MPRINAVDCASLFSVAEATAKLHNAPRYNLNYALLLRVLSDARKALKFQPAETNLAFVSVDPNSEQQRKFIEALKKFGYEIDVADFRDSFVSLPPGQLPGEEYRGIISLASRIAYLAGLLARTPDSQLLVVSHTFDIYWPLQSLSARLSPAGRVGVAFFSSMIDFRLRRVLSQHNSGVVQFYDMQDSLFQLLGAPEVQAQERHASGDLWTRL